jgi:hypothetical protein
LIEKYGMKWKRILECFHGRNEIQMKNRWNYTLSKQFSSTMETSDEENQKQEAIKNLIY